MALPKWEIGHLKLRPRLIWAMAMSSLRVRVGRSTLTGMTIATAAAFMTYLLTMPRTDDPTEAQSWMLMLVLSLVVSGAGVLNAMLTSVSQRYREIGTIKCLGAMDSLVLWSVLVESAVLGLGGAIAGLVVGLVVSLALGLVENGLGFFGTFFAGLLPASDLPAGLRAISPGGMHRGVWLALSAGFVFVVGMLLTTLGAAVPAFIASRMPPVEAMRGEK